MTKYDKQRDSYITANKSIDEDVLNSLHRAILKFKKHRIFQIIN